jgi:hypothetical protein
VLQQELWVAIANLGNTHWYRGDYDAAERAYQAPRRTVSASA